MTGSRQDSSVSLWARAWAGLPAGKEYGRQVPGGSRDQLWRHGLLSLGAGRTSPPPGAWGWEGEGVPPSPRGPARDPVKLPPDLRPLPRQSPPPPSPLPLTHGLCCPFKGA